MEALGAAASVIAVVPLAGKLSSLCWKYYLDAEDAKADIERLRNEMNAVQDVLDRARELAKGQELTRLVASKQLIEMIPWEIQKELEGLEKVLDLGMNKKAMRRWGLRALKWPLKAADVGRPIRVPEGHKTTLVAAMNIDQT